MAPSVNPTSTDAPSPAGYSFAMNSSGAISESTIALLKTFGISMEIIQKLMESGKDEINAFTDAKIKGAEAALNSGLDESKKLMFSAIGSFTQAGLTVGQFGVGLAMTSKGRGQIEEAQHDLNSVKSVESALDAKAPDIAARGENHRLANRPVGGDAVIPAERVNANVEPVMDKMKQGQLRAQRDAETGKQTGVHALTEGEMKQALQHVYTDEFKEMKLNVNERIKDRTLDVNTATTAVQTTQGYTQTVGQALNAGATGAFGWVQSDKEADKAREAQKMAELEATAANADKSGSMLTQKMVETASQAQGDLDKLKAINDSNRAS
jgi:hypothetical protein